MKEMILTGLNRVLVADFFLVLLGFVWFLIAVVGHYTGIPLGLELWYKLWIPLFNPAIGIMVGGAILNWTINKISQQLGAKSNINP